MDTQTLLYILLTTLCYNSTNGQECESVCEWMSWHEWSECSVTCGGGKQQRLRPLCCPDVSDFETCSNDCHKHVDDVTENRSCGEICLHDGSMKSDGYGCQCRNRTFGHCCEQLLPSCTPFPTDVIFVLDSSLSLSEEQFNKQLDFILQFIDYVNVSKEEFQIAIITFSFEAKVELHFNQSSDKDSLRNLIKEIKFNPGATFTDKGLNLALNVARQSERREGIVTLTYAFVLTDGMSTNRANTRIAAKALRDANVRVIAIGIGKEVSHQELIDIASPGDQHSQSYVFSVGDFNSLYTLLKQLVDITCDDCSSLSHYSDIVFLLDEGNGMTEKEFEISVDVIKAIVENTDAIGKPKGATFSLFQYKNSLKYVIKKSSDLSKNEIILQISVVSRTRDDVCSADDLCKDMNITTAINETFHTQINSSASHGARQFLVVLSNGQYIEPNIIKYEMSTFYHVADIKVFVIGVGPDINMAGLLALAKDASHVFVTEEGLDNSQFIVMQSEFTYNVCN